MNTKPENEEVKKRIDKYNNESGILSAGFSDTARLIADASVNDENEELISRLKKIIVDSECTDMKSFILKNAPEIPEKWIGPELRDDLLWCLEKITEWPVKRDGMCVYSAGGDLCDYAKKLILVIRSFHKWSIFRYSSTEVVTVADMSREDCDLWYHGKYGFFMYGAAARLAAGDEKTEKFVYDILDGTSKVFRPHKAFASCCFMSGIEKHYEKCYEYFKNAGVEEEARKMIADASTFGTPAAKSWFLRKINEDGLLRFDSVKKMFLSEYTLRYYAKELKDKVCTNMISVIADALEGKETEKYFSSSDRWTVYAAFAGTAGRSLKDFKAVFEKFIFEGNDIQKEHTHFFIEKCQVSLKSEYGRMVFEKCDDLRTLALFSDCFMADTPVYSMISQETGQFLYENGYYDYLIYADGEDDKPKGKTEPVYSPSLRDSADAEYLLGVVQKLYEKAGKDKYTFPSQKGKYTIGRAELAELICHLSFETDNRENIIKAAELLPEIPSRKTMTSLSGRDICLCLLFLSDKAAYLRQNVFPFLADKDRRTRLAAEYVLAETVPDAGAVSLLEEKLSVKSDEIRNIILKALERLDESKRYECALRLEADSHEERKKAGRSLMKTVSGKNIPVPVEKIQFFDADNVKYPEFVIRQEDISDFCSIFPGSVLNIQNGGKSSSEDERRILHELDEIFEENKNYEYLNYDGTAVLLGNKFDRTSSSWGLDHYPLSEVWKKFYEEKIGSYGRLLRVYLCFMNEKLNYFSRIAWEMYGKELEDTESLHYENHIRILLHLFRSMYADPETEKLIFRTMVHYTVNVLSDEEKTDRSRKNEQGYYEYGSICLDSDLYRFISFRGWGVYGKSGELSDDEFREYYSLNASLTLAFDKKYRKYGMVCSNWLFHGVLEENVRAYRLGMINRDTLLCIIYEYGISDLSSRFRRLVLSDNMDDQADDEIIRDLYFTLAVPMTDAELERDEEKTEYTDEVISMSAIYGTERFVKLLEYFESEKIHKRRLMWHENVTKNISFSHMLRVCIPAENEDVRTLRKYLNGKKISDQLLVEAALYSSGRWIKIIGEYLGWEGFEMCCLFFIAHTGSYISDEQKTVIEQHTRVKLYDIQSGVCDPEWLKKVYSETGEKHFKIIYDAAKYISENNDHTRARKYSDAVLDKYDADKIRQEVEMKRNKELLSAYALIPLKDNNDASERYLYFLRFHKEAKQFGKQRCESEQAAALTAIHNLALNAGYTDVHRFKLRMDSIFMEENSKYFEWTETEGVSLRIVLKEKGKAAVEAMKDGKILKSVPASLKKNDIVAELRNICSEITEQYRRTRDMFEKAMVNGISFNVSELTEYLDNPAAASVVRNLVFRNADRFGFFTEDGLRSYDGEVYLPAKDEKLIPAHCSDLFKAGVWREYQKYIYDTQTVQPFRQVFRELYIKTADESDLRYTCRYDGYRVDGRRALGCLSSGEWSGYSDDAVEKIFHDNDVMAEIHCSPYWYNGNMSAEPVIKRIVFYDYKKSEYIRIGDVPDVVFSEVMRDADLAVSAAHTGETDPETSLSTVEMRRSVAEFTLKLFEKDNVTFEKNHAFIKGGLADYSVHLGSGIVHISGGPQIVINTVKSSVKGKIFLPFEDDDDMTAGIITRILLLSEDKKIKDQYITGQIMEAVNKQ